MSIMTLIYHKGMIWPVGCSLYNRNTDLKLTQQPGIVSFSTFDLIILSTNIINNTQNK